VGSSTVCRKEETEELPLAISREGIPHCRTNNCKAVVQCTGSWGLEKDQISLCSP